MRTKKITGLNIEDCRILKKIYIIADRNYNESIIGQIFYKRKFHENYKFVKQEEDNSLINRVIEGYPKQENYPSDELDDLIFESIKIQYPKSIIKNDLIIFNVDLENLQILKNQKRIPSKMYITPTIYDTSNLFLYSGQSFDGPELDLNIYSNYSSEFLDNHIFKAKYDFSNSNINNLISTIEFE